MDLVSKPTHWGIHMDSDDSFLISKPDILSHMSGLGWRFLNIQTKYSWSYTWTRLMVSWYLNQIYWVIHKDSVDRFFISKPNIMSHTHGQILLSKQNVLNLVDCFLLSKPNILRDRSGLRCWFLDIHTKYNESYTWTQMTVSWYPN